MEQLTQRLLNDFQHNFPLNSLPFEKIARDLNTTTDTVLRELKQLQEKGAVSRVGPVFRPNTVGVSTLAASAVPVTELETIAAIINQFPQVNHNYEREHHYNLWFVVTATDHQDLEQTLKRIEAKTGYPILVLPLLRDYHIDLGFRMRLDEQSSIKVMAELPTCQHEETLPDRTQDAEDLIEVIQGGIPLVARPYQAIAQRLGCSERSVIEQLNSMINSGVIKRLGVVVRHHELGYRANAMVVWNVPDARVDQLGEQLGRQDCVTLCYQRPRLLPQWPFNLFCMVHGSDRKDVIDCINRMIDGLGLETIEHDVLFSGRRFKQRGARYRVRN
ncbi:MAG: Lrp/AsnC family transcriptional regulator [Gammaproteobacteria bacterium]